MIIFIIWLSNCNSLVYMIESQSLTSKLDALPFSRWHIFMIVGLGTIWIFDGYEVSLISLFSHYIIHETSEHDFKLIVTAYQIGCIIGSIGFGFCAYFYGRKTVFIVTLLSFRSHSVSMQSAFYSPSSI